MKKIHVDLGKKSYDIVIEGGLLDKVGGNTKALCPKAEKVAIISDSNVDALYGERLEQSLQNAGLKTARVVFPAGEQSKCVMQLAEIYDALVEAGLTRSDVILTLGGGVTGDLGGFAAATFLRGVDYIQIPTSLLAQIDSSVGGKVAVDLPGGKNLVGNFYQPKAVFIDTELLKTLPTRFLHDGLAEAIKYGCIKDAELFALIDGLADDEELMANIDDIVARCCAIKAEIVEHDEFDTGERMLLNFGHTIGHAIEKCCGFTTFTHGEGVGIGMVMLTERTEALGMTEVGTSAKISALLKKFDLPVAADYSQDDLLKAIGMDKKKSGSSITLVCLHKIGESFLQKTPMQELAAYVRQD